jgi:uncharacterized protein
MARSAKAKAASREVRGHRVEKRPVALDRGSQTSRPSPPTAGLAALIIFVKAPIPGQVKTRLCPPLTEEEAATLHGSLVLDVLERTRLPGVDRFMACAPSANHVFFKIMEERHRVRLLTQSNGDLGVRMRAALGAVLSGGYRAAVLIGTDVPAISRPLLSQAFARLDTHDVVLGPAVDGGYYLLGVKHFIPDLFDNMPWSTDRVCTMTEERARALQLKTALLPRHRDLDTVQDLLAILEEFGRELKARGGGHKRNMPSSSLEPQGTSLSKRTEGVLRTLAERIERRHNISPVPTAVR